MTTYNNDVLDHYADRFVGLGLSRLGYSLLQYLANPQRCELHDRYDRLRLARHGMRFDEYLQDPAHGERVALTPEPLLPAQHAAVLRLWAEQDTGLGAPAVTSAASRPENYQDWRELLEEWREAAAAVERDIAHLPRRNGAFVEPLHHHRHHARNAKAACFTPSKRGA